MDVDTRHLRCLVAVVDEGTFTDAAIALGVSQASVSRSVQRLETVLGVRLLRRSSRLVEPTAAGSQVLPHARRVLATLAQLDVVASRTAERLQVGYAWSAFGEHTVALQRAWRDHGYGELELVQSNTPSAGLVEGRCDVAVIRRPLDHPQLATARVGEERRYAALATDHALNRRGSLVLADFENEVIAVDVDTGTTTRELWATPDKAPALRPTHGVDDWLTVIAAGEAVGISSEATAAQHPRPGLTYRPVTDAPPIQVTLIWWKDDPPHHLRDLVELTSQALLAPSPPSPPDQPARAMSQPPTAG